MWKTCSLVLVLALAGSGCMSYAQVSDPSPRLLGVATANGESRADVATTANELTRVFGERGFILHAQHREASGEVALELWKTRRDVDSVYYAWVEPDGARGSQIWMIGGPVLWVDPEFADYTAQAGPWGGVEDQAAQGALAELELAGVVTGALPPGAVPPAGIANVQAHAHADCEAMRRDIAGVAGQQNDVDKRAEVLQTAPACGA